MNAQQMQKWATMRKQGRKSYVVKRALLWGALFSVWKILAYSFYRVYVAPTLATQVFRFIFKVDPPQDNPQIELQTIMRHSLEEIGMYMLVAAFIAFTIWAIKEREYGNARQSQQI